MLRWQEIELNEQVLVVEPFAWANASDCRVVFSNGDAELDAAVKGLFGCLGVKQLCEQHAISLILKWEQTRRCAEVSYFDRDAGRSNT